VNALWGALYYGIKPILRCKRVAQRWGEQICANDAPWSRLRRPGGLNCALSEDSLMRTMEQATTEMQDSRLELGYVEGRTMYRGTHAMQRTK
jgi:hypothetical protein